MVPKEVAGIMTAAAPFVAPASLPAAAALSIAGQLRTGKGRINPIATALSLAPGLKFDVSRWTSCIYSDLEDLLGFGQDAGASNLVGLSKTIIIWWTWFGESGVDLERLEIKQKLSCLDHQEEMLLDSWWETRWVLQHQQLSQHKAY